MAPTKLLVQDPCPFGLPGILTVAPSVKHSFKDQEVVRKSLNQASKVEVPK